LGVGCPVTYHLSQKDTQPTLSAENGSKIDDYLMNIKTNSANKLYLTNIHLESVTFILLIDSYFITVFIYLANFAI
jgi:hypothetical protein